MLSHVVFYIRHDLRRFWEHTRSAVSSRWAWLQRRIAELNKQIYRLDHHVKGSCSQEKFGFSSGPPNTSTAAVTSLLPQYFSISNGSMLDRWRTSNGSAGVIAVGKHGTNSIGNNGFSQHHSTGHPHCLPHLLLPEALLGAKLQVKDLLSPSTVERNSYLDEASCTAARTRSVCVCVCVCDYVSGGCELMCSFRALVRRVNRKIVRKKLSGRSRNSSQHLADPAFHPYLSMAHGDYIMPVVVSKDHKESC